MSRRIEWARPPAARRSLAIAGVALVLAWGLHDLPRLASTARPSAARPNIVLIVTDDQRADTLWAMPAVRRLLSAHGVTFTNAFATTPLCCPSRASIFTGQYSHRTGVLSNNAPDGGAPAFDDSSTIATWLSSAGYETALVGKYLNRYAQLGPTYIPPGWDRWYAIASDPTASRYYDYTLNDNGHLATYGASELDYSTAVLGRLAVRFLGSARPPFFLALNAIAPHAPAHAAPVDEGAAMTVPDPRPPSFDEADVSDKPWGETRARMSGEAIAAASRLRVSMLRSLLEVDRAVEAIVDELTSTGQISNTVVALTSDNGMLLGEHRLHGKLWPYEESIRVPLVIRTPWTSTPVIDERLVLNIDLAPTFAELAGVTPDIPVDGRSLAPLLRSKTADERWRRGFVVEYLGHEHPSGGPPPYQGARTERFLYVEYSNGWRELYDLRRDPYQLDDLAGRRPRLEARLRASFERLIDPSRAVPEPRQQAGADGAQR